MTDTGSTKAKRTDASRDFAAEAKSYADQAMGAARDTLADHAEAQADTVARAGAGLSGTPYVREAATHLSASLLQVADALRTTDLEALQSDARAFASQNPALFYGGAAALGFLATRAMKASDRSATGSVSAPESAPGGNGPAHTTARKWGYV
ncbi:hypothetical protein JANAI62_25010 [Jannaschia pagri]|uniref:Membrane-anchored ribosome-binding protein, inhibits growth in stationary phase, ElaB/YqjD/DUF883 family n=1 Tax=Jannaschia pagri TaxID=2829797 RepID=A0ABQ4NN86_9RHOB|nr:MULTISPECIES: hypothetical protein [unclassified Jannaschia]GIT92044.1 hypothetical protein JANAI61_25020 [Jannaschia sp. AI_61]GIT95878.1 hypothetical protein JANAI62_25010 [Jannaschia sp. AI_62]